MSDTPKTEAAWNKSHFDAREASERLEREAAKLRALVERLAKQMPEKLGHCRCVQCERNIDDAQELLNPTAKA